MKEKDKNKNKKIKKAAALKYRHGEDSAPVLTAKGKGKTAETIIRLAKEHDIPLKEDPGIIDMLCTLELDQKIPPELYKAVAEILAFIYKMGGKHLSGKTEKKTP